MKTLEVTHETCGAKTEFIVSIGERILARTDDREIALAISAMLIAASHLLAPKGGAK